jgi:membrane peptidoglycan carboxypeptidase
MSTFLLFVLLTLLTLGAAAYGAYAYFAKDLPSIDDIKAVKFETTRIYDRYGNFLYEMYDQDQGKRTYVTIDKMPSSLIAATIAVEDKTFERNTGVDPEAFGTSGDAPSEFQAFGPPTYMSLRFTIGY